MLSFFFMAAKAEESSKFWVKTTSLECVIRMIDGYRQLGKDPVLVFFDICPRLEPNTEEELSYATNSLPHISVNQPRHNETLKLVFPFRLSELDCLKNMADTNKLFTLQKKIQGFNATMIDISSCTAITSKNHTQER